MAGGRYTAAVADLIAIQVMEPELCSHVCDSGIFFAQTADVTEGFIQSGCKFYILVFAVPAFPGPEQKFVSLVCDSGCLSPVVSS